MANTYMKRYSASSGKCKAKSQIIYYLIPVRTAVIKKTRDTTYWQGCGEKGTFVGC